MYCYFSRWQPHETKKFFFVCKKYGAFLLFFVDINTLFKYTFYGFAAVFEQSGQISQNLIEISERLAESGQQTVT